MRETIKLNVNGATHELATDSKRLLLDVLREDLHLTGTKYGCGEGACGACSVLIDGKRVFSCSATVGEVVGKQVTTIEGIAGDDSLHPVQRAFLHEGASQCGYCTPGMIVAAVALLDEKPKPSDQDLITGMNGNLCRCCNYVNILNAVRRAATTVATR
jgi:aerobic-type carbon monoxide dehydrogenase small subunit (CoxS/CutS family)